MRLARAWGRGAAKRVPERGGSRSGGRWR